MKICKAEISKEVYSFLRDNLLDFSSYKDFNFFIYKNYKLISFCDSSNDFSELKNEFRSFDELMVQEDRTEYGDFQTPVSLAERTCQILKAKKIKPTVCIEPTCGKGHFVLESLKVFQSLKRVFGIEIYKPYVWETKFRILDFYLKNASFKKPEIQIFHEDFFLFDFKKLITIANDDELLLIGNPPWVTNSKLGELESKNLPQKSNFKKLDGFEALTGKSNFDIAEYILFELFQCFDQKNGNAVFLVKNSVIKNFITDSVKGNIKIGDFIQYEFNAKKEFGVATEASAFFTRLNGKSTQNCIVKYLDEPNVDLKTFGWLKDKFVSNIRTYQLIKQFDGICPFVWRSGMKHDCSRVFELKKENEHYLNKAKEILKLEQTLIYPLIKSSQLKKQIISESTNYVIVTQKKIGQPTSYIEDLYPLLFAYLQKNKDSIDGRKSSIYKNKPPFSIFGIGDYTFKKYKIAISGLYKKAAFSLLLPNESKPLMTDDTCYTLGFDNLNYAIFTLLLLNSKNCLALLDALTFQDAKRVYTKDVLMRIDLKKLLLASDAIALLEKSNQLLSQINKDEIITMSSLHQYRDELIGQKKGQMALF